MPVIKAQDGKKNKKNKAGVVTTKTKCTKSGCYNEAVSRDVKVKKSNSEAGKSAYKKKMRQASRKKPSKPTPKPAPQPSRSMASSSDVGNRYSSSPKKDKKYYKS
jgi:hypothetical protein